MKMTTQAAIAAMVTNDERFALIAVLPSTQMLNRLTINLRMVLFVVTLLYASQSLCATESDLSASQSDAKINNGREKFRELFQLNDKTYKVVYKLTQIFPPTPTALNIPIPATSPIQNSAESHNLALLNDYSNRIKNGFQSITFYTFYISDNSRLAIHRLDSDPWNNGYSTDSYFNNENVIQVEPSSKLVTILPRDANEHPELAANFPALHNMIGLVPDALEMQSVGEFTWFVVAKKTLPAVFSFKVDHNGRLVFSEEMNYRHKRLRTSTFQYSELSPLWPSHVAAVVSSGAGTKLWEENWQLLSIDVPPKGSVSFDPVIDKKYHVTDRTGSNIPESELNKLINQ